MNETEQNTPLSSCASQSDIPLSSCASQSDTPLSSCASQSDVAGSTELNEETPQEQAPEIDYSGMPRINWGALFMPAVWGPAHGQWINILFYPLWLFADTSITNAVFFGGFTYVLAASVILGTAAITVFFALTIGRKAYARVAHKMTMQQYKARERTWTVISLLIALAFLGLATWYNLAIRLPQGPPS